MTELMSQAAFARRKGVSRKSVTLWKSEGRIVMVGDRVDVDASEARLLATTRHRAAKAGAAVTPALCVTHPLCADHLAGEDYGALTVAQRLVEVAPAVLRLAASEAGLPSEHTDRLLAQFRISMMEAAGLLLDGMAVPPPPGISCWLEAPMWAPHHFPTVVP